MGLFGSIGKTWDSFLGGGGDDGDSPQASLGTLGGQFNDIFLANYFFPQLFQYLDAASTAGGGAPDLAQFTKSGKAIPTGVNDIDFGALSAALPGMKQKAAEKQAQNFQATYDMFSKIPALSDIFSKASGNVDSTGALAKIFGDLSGSALGSVANTGFLSDPTKQANTLGPLALQKYQIEQSIQQGAQAQALGLAGAGGLPAAGLFGQSQQGVSPYSQASLAAGGLFGPGNASNLTQASFLNSQMKQQQSQFESSQWMDLLGFGAGIALAPYTGGASLALAGGGGGGGGSSTGWGWCWVADELYGLGSDKAAAARLYTGTHDSAFLRLYKRHGKAWAAWLAENKWAKPMVAPIWDEMARRGMAMLGKAVAA